MVTANHLKTKQQRPDFPLRPTVLGRVAAITVACFLGLACVFCARLGVADHISTEAIKRQIAFQEAAANSADKVIAANDANTVIAALLSAQRINPGNPQTAEELGGAYTLDVRASAPRGEISREWVKAFDAYSTAVVLRPTSPYSWANRAWTKYHLGQIDDEFYRAFLNAIDLGPWEPEVQFVVLDLGFALWEKLPDGLQPKVLTMGRNAQRRYGPKVIEIARKHGRLADVCRFEKLASTPSCKQDAG